MHHRSLRHLLPFAVTLLSACAEADAPARSGPAPAAPQSAPQVVAPAAVSSSATAASAIPRTVPPPIARQAGADRDVARPSGTRRIIFGYMDFTGVGHDRGNPAAPVVVIDLSDFACPYCGVFARDVFPAIDREYVQTGKVLYKYIPFIAGSFPHAAQATRAAECAAEQGQFWAMADHLYATQAEWKRGRAVDAQMAALAGTLPVDTTLFAACYTDRRTDVRTARGTQVANSLGVRVTPSFLVDGNPVQGALPLTEFRRQIETALLLHQSRGSLRTPP